MARLLERFGLQFTKTLIRVERNRHRNRPSATAWKAPVERMDLGGAKGRCATQMLKRAACASGPVLRRKSLDLLEFKKGGRCARFSCAPGGCITRRPSDRFSAPGG